MVIEILTAMGENIGNTAIKAVICFGVVKPITLVGEISALWSTEQEMSKLERGETMVRMFTLFSLQVANTKPATTAPTTGTEEMKWTNTVLRSNGGTLRPTPGRSQESTPITARPLASVADSFSTSASLVS